MKVKFLKPYHLFKPGDAADLGRGVAQALIQRGRAVEVPVENKRRSRKSAQEPNTETPSSEP